MFLNTKIYFEILKKSQFFPKENYILTRHQCQGRTKIDEIRIPWHGGVAVVPRCLCSGPPFGWGDAEQKTLGMT